MKKGSSFYKFSRTTNERKQLFRNLVKALVNKGSIMTTLTKAKFLSPNVEKFITISKIDTLSSLRKLAGETGDLETAKKLVKYGKLFSKRHGGYTRIIKIGRQIGDNSELVKIEFVEKIIEPEIIKSVKTNLSNKTNKANLPIKTEKKETKTDLTKKPK